MIKKNYRDVKEEVVTKADSKKTTVRWLIKKEDGSTRFATRRFEIESNGEIGLHNHPEEHHIYVLQGSAEFIGKNGEIMIVNKDDVVYIPPNETHSIKPIGTDKFIFLCVIPYL